MKLKLSQETIINKYIELANKLKYHPTRSELILFGVSRDRIRQQFGTFTKLQEFIKNNYNLDLPDSLLKEIKKPKVLFFDIETAPIQAYVWGLWDNNVALNQIHTDWFVLSWSAKWLDKDDVMYQDQRKAKNVENDKKLLRGIWKLLDEADIVVTQNGDKFDRKKLNARFVINGLQPPSSYQSIDTLKLAKKHFGFTSNKLEYLSKKLNINYKKQEHKKFPGFDLWKECMSGNLEAWQEMETYNKYDVLALEEVFKKINPWNNDVNFNLYHDEDITVCKCGNDKLVRNGFYYTSNSKFQRYKCSICGSEFRDTKRLGTTSKVGTKR